MADNFSSLAKQGIRSMLLIGGIFGSTVATVAHAEDAKSTELKPSDIRGAMKKKPISVLQNRYFLKTYRPELGFSGGWFLNEAYTNTKLLGGRAALFFNEYLGAEVQYIKTSVGDSDDRKALNKLRYKRTDDVTGPTVSPDPEVNAVHSIVDFDVIVAPFYGKLNFVDALIVYTDVYVTTGVAKIESDQGDITAMIVGAGQRFYWQKNISFRVDFRDRIYREKRGGDDVTKNSLAIDIGMSYFFL